MQLHCVSFQNYAQHGYSVRDAYASHSSNIADPKSNNYMIWKPIIDKMLELLEYLENHVEAQPVWVCCSHDGIILYRKDCMDIDDTNNEPRISVGTRMIYEVRYSLPKHQSPWCEVVGYSENMQVAVGMIVEAINRITEYPNP